MKIPAAVIAALLIIAGFLLWLRGHDAGVRADALHAQQDSIQNVIRAAQRRTADSAQRVQDLVRDSTGREIRILLQRIAGGRPATPQPPEYEGRGDSVGGRNEPATSSADQAASAPLRLRDSLIATLLAGRRADSLTILFWRSQTAQRDTLIKQLTASRDQWRKVSEHRFGCVGGATVAVGFTGQAVAGAGLTCGIRL